MPDAGIGGITDILSGLLGEGSIARQMLVWGVAQQVIGQLLQPMLTDLANKVNSDHPEVAISAADLADMVVRGVAGIDWAKTEAAKTGVSENDFTLMVTNTGEPPALEEMLVMYRRGEITRDELHRAVLQSRVRDEWWQNGIIEKIGIAVPSPADIIDAAIKSQLSDADARALYERVGADPQYYDLLYGTAGSAPSPDQAASMARRGIIPWDGTGPDVVSYAQAVREGHWRNKWGEAFRALSDYLPPPRTVVTLIHQGVLSDAQALRYLLEQGMTPELAAAYVAEGHSRAVTSAKTLAAGTIETLYADQAITGQQATALFRQIGYSDTDIPFLLLVQDLKREERYLNAAVAKIHALYISHKIDENTMTSALSTLNVATAQVTHLKTLWDLERSANVRTLTPAQIVGAYKYSIIDQATAQAELEALGYQPHDAWTYLSVELHAPQPNEPPATAVTG